MEENVSIEDKIKKIHKKYSNTPVSRYEDYQANVELLNSSISSAEERNIAIIGSYGSGKSSVVKSYLDKYKKHNKAIKISLASFNKNIKKRVCFTNDAEGQIEKKDKNVIEKADLEKSILQQFVYEKSYNRLKNTNIKRIKEPTKTFLNFTSIAICMLFLSIISLIMNQHGFIWEFQKWIQILTTSISAAIFCILIFIIVYNLRLSRLSLKAGDKNISLDAEISSLANSKQEISILNAFADEIIYSLHKSGYNIVIIEDLDRVGSLEIFVKLRELNWLINNNEYFKNNKVSFVYCLDDLFFDDSEERSKFFDRIISVEPYLNYTNARSRIDDLLKGCGYFSNSDTEGFANSLAPFIQSQRTLNNIFYDFEIHKINEGLRENSEIQNQVDNRQILALLTFKNLYPAEFAKLYASEGILFALFGKIKNELINNKLKELDGLIQEKIDILTKSLQEPYKCLEELQVFICGVASNVNKFYHQSSSVKTYNISDLSREICDVNFKFPYSNVFFKMKDIDSYIQENSLGLKISDRVESILLKQEDENNLLRNEIEKLKKDKVSLRSLTLNEYINRYSVEDVKRLIPIQNDFLILCLAKNYINENYIFQVFTKSENNTANDLVFIKNVNLKVDSDYEYKIENPTSVIRSISEEDFQYTYILNNDIVKILTINFDKNTNSDLSKKSEKIIQLLDDNSEKTTDFLYEFIKCDESHVKLLEKTAFTNQNLYKLLLDSELSIDVKQYIITILLKSRSENLVILNEGNVLTNYINTIENQDFIDFDDKRIITNLRKLKVHFSVVQSTLSGKTLRIIGDEKLFLPTSDNLLAIMQKGFTWKNNEILDFKKILIDLTRIKNHEEFKSYILDYNIAFIVNDLCSKKVTNIIVPKEKIVLFLENDQYTDVLKKKIIINCEFKLSENIIVSKDLKDLLIIKNRFENSILISYQIYKESSHYIESISKTIYDNLDKYNNSEKFTNEELDDTREFRFQLFNKLLNISNEKKLFYTKSVTKILSVCQIERVSFEDIKDKENLLKENYLNLIENKKLILDQSMVDYISKDKQKVNDFIKFYKEELYKNIVNLDLSGVAKGIIFNKLIDIEFKRDLIVTYNDKIFIENDDEYSEICKLLKTMEDKVQLVKICINSGYLTEEQKINIFSEYEHYISDHEYVYLLQTINPIFNELNKSEFNIHIPRSQITDSIIRRLKSLTLINKQSGKVNKDNEITLKRG